MQKLKILCFSVILTGLNFLPIYSNELYTTVQIVEKVLKGNSNLKANNSLVRAAEEKSKQAKAIPNPELEVGLENFGVNEIEVVLSQPIELGGKRAKRIQYVNKEIEASKLDFENKTIEVEANVYRNIIPILALNNDIQILESIIAIVDSASLLIEKRISAGANSSVDLLRASMELDQLKLKKEMFEDEKFKRSNNLSSLWGDSSNNRIAVNGILNSDVQIPSIELYKEKFISHPDMKKMSIEKELSEIELLQAHKDAIPDLGISGGYLRNNESGENAVLFSASIELPVFNRNSGEINKLKSTVQSKVYEVEGAQTNRRIEISTVYNELQRIDVQIKSIKEKILPKSREILSTVFNHYGNGAISFLDVLEAQREDLELKLEMNNLEKEKALLITDLFELTGYKLETFKISN